MQIQYSNIQTSQKPGWLITTIFILAFPPVGFILAIYKLHHEKGNYMSNGTKTFISGIYLCVMGAVMFLGTVPGSTGEIDRDVLQTGLVITAVFCILGAILIQQGLKYKRIGRQNQALVNQAMDSVSQVMDTVNKAMRGVDWQFSGENGKTDAGAPSPAASVKQEPKKPRVIQCPHCNGVNEIKEGTAECRYCGLTME